MMPTIKQQFIDAIDQQDVATLETLLGEHDFDLNRLMDNGASALWLALTPPLQTDGTQASPSLDIIQALIDSGRVKGDEAFAALSLEAYAKKIQGLDRQILLAIQEFEQDARQEKARVAALKANQPKPQSQLQQLATNADAAHNEALYQPIIESYAKLYERYLGSNDYNVDWGMPAEVDKIIRQIKAYATQHCPPNQARDIAAMIDRAPQRSGATGMTTIRLSNGKTSTLHNLPLHACVWMAHCDNDPLNFHDGIDLSDKAIHERKMNYLQAVADAYRYFPPRPEYGETEYQPLCQRMTRNNCIETLNTAHIDVEMSNDKLTAYIAAQKYCVLSSNFLKDLAGSDLPAFWDVMYYYQLLDLPGGCDSSMMDTPPKSTAQLVQDKRADWIKQLKNAEWVDTSKDAEAVRGRIFALRQKYNPDGSKSLESVDQVIAGKLNLSVPKSGLSDSARVQAMVAEATKSEKEALLEELQKEYAYDEFTPIKDNLFRDAKFIRIAAELVDRSTAIGIVDKKEQQSLADGFGRILTEARHKQLKPADVKTQIITYLLWHHGDTLRANLKNSPVVRDYLKNLSSAQQAEFTQTYFDWLLKRVLVLGEEQVGDFFMPNATPALVPAQQAALNRIDLRKYQLKVESDAKKTRAVEEKISEFLTERAIASLKDTSITKWRKGLKVELAPAFARAFIEKGLHINTASKRKALLALCGEFGLRSGYIDHLNLSGHAFKGLDLRGVDLSKVDVSNIDLQGCDLRLTGIEKNPKLRVTHRYNNFINNDQATRGKTQSHASTPAPVLDSFSEASQEELLPDAIEQSRHEDLGSNYSQKREEDSLSSQGNSWKASPPLQSPSNFGKSVGAKIAFAVLAAISFIGAAVFSGLLVASLISAISMSPIIAGIGLGVCLLVGIIALVGNMVTKTPNIAQGRQRTFGGAVSQSNVQGHLRTLQDHPTVMLSETLTGDELASTKASDGGFFAKRTDDKGFESRVYVHQANRQLH